MTILAIGKVVNGRAVITKSLTGKAGLIHFMN